MGHFIHRGFRFNLERFLTFGHISKVPQRQIVFGYLSYIIVGVLLLSLPFSTKVDIPVIDNLFTITSAVSTTGLGTVSTSDGYTWFGQVVILLMIQLGGVGYMTLSSFLFFSLTRHFIRIKKGVLQTSFTIPDGIQIHNMVQGIVAFTVIFEVIGSVLLYFAFCETGVDTPLWSAVFHAVSAFCTAGFSLYNNSLEQFRSSVSVNVIISVLSYAGAMGFIVMHDLWAKVRNFKYKITFTTKVIVVMTIVMTAIGTTQIFFFEPAVTQFPIGERFMISVFQSMGAMTTVGFQTIQLGGLLPATLLVMVLIMYIGASPSGTGGGLKSTTATTAFAFVWAKLGLERDVTLFGHRLPTYRLDSALTTFVFYTTILFVGLYVLIIAEDFPMIDLLFEASSALGTVGISTGITPQLSTTGKITIIILMYIGRIGVLTFGSSMLIRLSRKESIKPATDDDIAI